MRHTFSYRSYRRRVVTPASTGEGAATLLGLTAAAPWLCRLLAALAVALLTSLGFGPARASADTSCQGFGAGTPGGTGAAVYHVTTTADQGPGSLRDAVSAGNRRVVFDVGGWFDVESDIVIGGPFITIDGTTAPIPVRLVYNGLVVSGAAGAHDVIIKHIRVGNAGGPAAISIIDGAFNVVVQQVSIHDATGGSLDISGAHDISVCWSLLANPGDHNMSIGSGSARVSLHNNVFVGAVAGNPTVTNNAAGTPAPATTLDMFNNIVWAWGTGWGTLVSHGAAANVVGNLYGSPGSPPDAQADALIVCNGDCVGGAAANARAHVASNASDSGVDIDAQSTEAAPFPAPTPIVGDACLTAHATVASVGVRPLDLIDQGALEAVVAARELHTRPRPREHQRAGRRHRGLDDHRHRRGEEPGPGSGRPVRNPTLLLGQGLSG